MPLFFFRFEDGGPAVDGLSLELPNLLAARMEATLYAGQMLRDRPDAVWAGKPWRVTVTDKTGTDLLVLTLEGRAASAVVHQLRPNPD